MDVTEAGGILEQQIGSLRERPYSELKQLVEARVIQTLEIVGASGTRYNVEAQALWDSKKRDNIRVLASIDDGGTRAFHPVTCDFIKAPDGSFVGE
jgi:hypothetical protein